MSQRPDLTSSHRINMAADADVDKLRLIVRVARMYHERGLRQAEIAKALGLSQAGVSRLLRQAADLGVVRTIVVSPPGIHSELEDALADRYHLTDVVILDGDDLLDHPRSLMRALGSAAAGYLETAFRPGDLIGVSTWSETLLAAVESMQPAKMQGADKVVQLMGGMGDPQGQVQATRLAARLAELTGATPLFVRAPGLVGSAEARLSLLHDPAVLEVSQAWQQLTAVLVGIGSLQPSPLLRLSGNAVAEGDRAAARPRRRGRHLPALLRRERRPCRCRPGRADDRRLHRPAAHRPAPHRRRRRGAQVHRSTRRGARPLDHRARH